jgi:hypothetical protein
VICVTEMLYTNILTKWWLQCAYSFPKSTKEGLGMQCTWQSPNMLTSMVHGQSFSIIIWHEGPLHQEGFSQMPPTDALSSTVDVRAVRSFQEDMMLISQNNILFRLAWSFNYRWTPSEQFVSYIIVKANYIWWEYKYVRFVLDKET